MKYCAICKEKFDDNISFCPKDGEVLEDDPSSIVGTVLDGQYKIESLLGKGGMGAVYLARHILLGDRVAIKILPPEVRNNAEWLRRFRREGQAARRFRHANAVTVYDLRTAADGTIYMVMEYVEGSTLDAELRKRGRFTAGETFETLEPIMSVLNTAHAMGVVHRDLKPENIMIGKPTHGGEPSIKLLDLGIAKMREIAGVDSGGTTELTMAGQVLGTPYYMSPEQWGELSRDGNPEIDGRTDIYSLGLVAYQMISGHRPYSGKTLHELRQEHLSVKPPPLSEAIPEVPAAFGAAIDRAISKDRVDRQPTAGELASELRAGLADGVSGSSGWRPAVDTQDALKTAGVPEARNTKTDVNAPTIITVDAVPTTPPGMAKSSVPSSGNDALSAAAFAGRPPFADPTDMSSSVTLVKERHGATPSAAPAKARGKSLALVGAGAVVIIIAVVAVGGLLAVKLLQPKTDTSSSAGSKSSTKDAKGTSATSTLPAKEFGRYWLEVLPNALAAEPQRVAGASPLASGQAFKFHFDISDDGYLYIIGPGEQNQLTAFLTNKPAPISGLETNQVVKGSDFSFPSGIEHWLELDKKPGTENYMVIFSREQLSTPAFLTSQATGKPLAAEEQQELNSFLSQHKTNPPVTEINDKGGTEPFVAVKMAQPNDSAGPVVFQIRIQHK